MTSALQQIIGGYIAAIFFTETGDTEQPPEDSELSAPTRYEAERDCARFLAAYKELLESCGASWEQIGHDLWLTRQGHGVGFWERDDSFYPKATRDELTRASKFIGEVGEIVFVHEEVQPEPVGDFDKAREA